MDILVAPGLAPPATLPPERVAAQGITVFRAAFTAWASLPTDDPASTAWSARLLGDVELSQSAVDALGIGGRVALGLADIDMWDGDGAFADLARHRRGGAAPGLFNAEDLVGLAARGRGKSWTPPITVLLFGFGGNDAGAES